jgi:hypothetical protein
MQRHVKSVCRSASLLHIRTMQIKQAKDHVYLVHVRFMNCKKSIISGGSVDAHESSTPSLCTLPSGLQEQ